VGNTNGEIFAVSAFGLSKDRIVVLSGNSMETPSLLGLRNMTVLLAVRYGSLLSNVRGEIVLFF
jgi:hypothetical protein